MIYFYCNPSTIHFFLDYINSIKANYNNVEIIIDTHALAIKMQNSINSDLYIFVQYMPPIYVNTYANCALLNTEQLSKIEWVQTLCNIPIEIVDYSMANIYCLFPYRQNLHYLPYMVNRAEIYDFEKTLDVACIGCWTDSYRLYITKQLPNINIIEGYNEKRDEQLFRHKILLNVHFNEKFKIFEQMRCNRCIFNKMIVITEKSLDINFELKKYIIECEYDELVSMTNKVLNNYEYYYNMMFSDFDISKIEKMYKDNADTVIRKLTQ